MKKLLFFLTGISMSAISIAQLPTLDLAFCNDSTTLGGSLAIENIALDATGNSYVTGYYANTADFDPGPGVFDLTSPSSSMAFFAKYDASGNLVWAKSLDGLSQARGYGIAVDATGNIYITGSYTGTIDLDPGPGADNFTTTLANGDIFFASYDASGIYRWGYGCSGTDFFTTARGNGVAVDGAGNVVFTGIFSGTTDFDPGPGVANLSSFGGAGLYFAKYDTNGNYIYAKGIQAGNIPDITIDASDNIYLTGAFSGTVDFDPNAGTANLASLSGLGRDAFFAKYTSAGNYVFAKNIGGSSFGVDAFGTDIGLNVAGEIIICGYYNGTVDFNPGAGTANLTSAGGNDAFIAKYSTVGNYIWADGIAGTSNQVCNSLAVDASSNIIVTGYFQGTTDFDPGAGTANIVGAANTNIFIAKYNNAGAYVWANGIGTIFSNQGLGVAVDVAGNVHAVGHFQETTDFDPGAGTANLTSAGGINGFLAVYTQAGAYTRAGAIGGYFNGNSSASGLDIVDDASGNMIIAGDYTGEVDFDPGAGVAKLTWVGQNKHFIAKYDPSGNFLWAFDLSIVNSGDPIALAVDAAGNVYVTGAFINTVDFDPGPGTANLTSVAGTSDIFIAKYDASGNYVWAHGMGDAGNYQKGYDIEIDAAGNLVIAGMFDGTIDFDPGAGTANYTAVGFYDGFIAKYDASGTFVFAKHLESASFSEISALEVDGTNNIYITGRFSGNVDFDPDAGVVNINSPLVSAFVAKYNSNGNYVWANALVGDATTHGRCLALDNTGDVYAGGTFQGTTDFDGGAGTVNLTTAGSDDVYFTRYDTNGNFVWAKAIGGTSQDYGLGIEVNAGGTVVLAGYFYGTMDFDPGAGVANVTSGGQSDMFISGYDPSGNYLWEIVNGSTWTDEAYALDISSAGGLLATGKFAFTVDFDPSAAVFNLSANPSQKFFTAHYLVSGNSYSTINPEACLTYTVPSGDETHTASGTYMDTLINYLGFDSIMTINLTIHPHDTTNQTFVECDGFTVTVGANTYSTTGVYTDVLTSVFGCDSTVITDLTINMHSTGTDVQTACDSYTWIDSNTYTTSNNTATFTLTNAAGCDSVVTLDLTMNYSNTGTDVQTACDSYTWIDSNTYTSDNNTATFTLTNAAGCDSVVTLDLTINNSNTGTDVITACDSYTWIDSNTYTTSNNTATFTLTNAAGCDSVVTLDLTINYSNTGTDVQTACDSYTWIDSNTYTASNNTATFTLTNAAGCDSVVTLDLTMSYSNTGTDVQTACDSYTWIDSNTYTASNNTATFTLTNAAGCDSVVTLDLTMNYSNTGTDVQVACGSYTWIDSNTYTANNNTATFTITNAAGCDSVVTLDLTILTQITSSQTFVECDGFSVSVGTNTYNSTGIYTDTLSSINGCDSIVTTDLTVMPAIGSSQTFVECDGFSITVGTSTYTSTGIYTDVLTAANGCDSTVTTDLTVHPANGMTQTFMECDGFSITVGANTYNTTGIYTDVFTDVNGCDSTVTTDLTISSQPVATFTTTFNGAGLFNFSADNVSIDADYLWKIDNSPISTAQNFSYNFTTPGSYDVCLTVTENGCVDSTCQVISVTVGMNEIANNFGARLFPNPTTGNATLLFDEVLTENTTMIIRDITGKEVYPTQTITGKQVDLDLSLLNNGIYFIQLRNDQINHSLRLVKQD